MWKLNKKSLLLAILLYSYIPLFIFLLGWVKLYIALPSCLVLLYFLYRFYQEKKKDISDAINVHWSVLTILSVLVLIICILCGYGGFVNQASDWIKHNAILQDLYTHTWPVTYTINNETTLLTYYHGLYLPAALVGKCFSSHFVTELTFGIIGYIGLWLMTISLIYITRADKWYKQLGVFLLFVSFSGLMFPLQKICHLVTGDGYCNNWHALVFNDHMLQFRSIFVMLRWVGPQCFTVWLSLILFLLHKDDLQWYALIALPVLLSGTWAFLGLIVIMMYYAIYLIFKYPRRLKNLFSGSNILPIITSGMLFFLYLLGNKVVQGDSTDNHTFGLIQYQGIEWVLYLLFVIITYGIYVFITWYENKKDILFYIIPLSFILIPLFSIGSEADFCMGVSIPAIILLFTYVAKMIIPPPHSQFAKHSTRIMILLCIILGLKYPVEELKVTVLQEGLKCQKDYSQQTMEICFLPDNISNNTTGILWQNYISQDLEHNIFYKHISKTKK